MAGIFAVSLVFADQVLPGKSERLTSLLIAAGGLGGALVPYLTGWSMDNLKVGGTQKLLAALALLLLGLIWTVYRRQRAQAVSPIKPYESQMISS